MIFRTAQLVVSAGAEIDLEDAQQRLRIKTWKALKAFDPDRCRTTRQKYVYMCITDEKKDLLKKKRRGELFIEDLVVRRSAHGPQGDFDGDSFHEHYLSEDPEHVYGAIDEDDVLIPSTVTRFEKRVLLLLYTGDYKQREIADRLGADKREVERAIRALRDKFADWRPDSENPIPAVAA